MLEAGKVVVENYRIISSDKSSESSETVDRIPRQNVYISTFF